MRIGFVLYGKLEDQSGGFLYDRLVLERLRLGGDEVEVLSLPWRGYFPSLMDNLDQGLRLLLTEKKWDILVQDELAHPSLITINRQIHQQGMFPVVSLVHLLNSASPHPRVKQNLYRLIERQYLRNVDGCIFVSQHNRHLAERMLGFTPPFTIAYPAGDHLPPKISPAQISARAEQARELRIVFLGALIPRKALHVLLQALERLDQIEWQLQVIGSPDVDPKYAAEVSAQAQHPGLAGRVFFLGHLSHTEIARCLADCDVMALPSAAEGYAIAYLEAMGHGLPVIATLASGAVELIQHGNNGFLIQLGDVTSITTHLRTLAKNPALRERMSLAARRSFDEHPGWADTTRVIREFLSKMVQQAKN
jgi:glycosyltransferase involved in cell wall biosynthesis